MKLSTKFVITVCIGAMGLLCVIAISLVQITRVHQITVDYSNDYYPSLENLKNIDLNMERLRGISLEMVIAGRSESERGHLKSEFLEARDELIANLDEYRKHMIADDIERALFRATEVATNQAVERLYEAGQLGRKPGSRPALEGWEDAHVVVDAAFDAIRKNSEYKSQLAQKRRLDADADYLSALVISVGTSGLVILALCASAVWAYHGIIGPIKTLGGKLDEISASLDLRTRIDLGNSNEMRHATEAINRLLERAHGGMVEIKDKHSEAAHAATHDPLTGLPNRALAMERLQDDISMAKHQGKQVALLFVDLDGFKAVNDTHGHDAGDHVLQEVARRLKASLREGDTAARLGGDEYLAVIGGLSEPKVVASIAEKIIHAIGTPYTYRGETLRIGSSIGIAVYPAHAADADSLMHAADTAMYEVKRSGKNNYRFAEVPHSTLVTHAAMLG